MLRALALIILVPFTSTCRSSNPPQGEGACASDPLGETGLRATVEALADPDLEGRWPGTAGDREARAYIRERFECLGLEAPGGAHEQGFTTDEGESTANVVGVLRGRDPEVAGEVVVIGAHHDHLGIDEAGIYAGANDDASGVALLLGLAEVLAERGTDRTVVFAAFGAEEQGYLGSQAYVADPPGDLAIANTVFMVNLDMVGRYGDEGILHALHTFEGTPGRAVLDDLVGEFPDLEVSLGDAGAEADHLTFCEAGVPVTFFFTDDTECYHQTCDVPDHLDWAGNVRVAELVLAFVEVLADADLDLATARRGGCGD